MPKSEDLRKDVYRKLNTMLTTLQSIQGAKSCRIANYEEPSEPPMTSGANMVNSLHLDVCKYFKFHCQGKAWKGQTIPNRKTRKIEFIFLLESDKDIDELVEIVQIDLMDFQIDLYIKTCQSISHEDRLHLVRVSNSFSRLQVQQLLQDQLQSFQESVAEFDKNSYLGKKQESKVKFPPLDVQLEYPYNGPWEKTKDGEDTRYKRMFRTQYATHDKVHVETGINLFKKSGKLIEYWGQHANLHYAADKDDEKTSTTTKKKWHSICDSHSATMLSMGMMALDDLKNPDEKVKMEYWKTSKKDRVEYMSIRDVLHSVKVPGPNEEDVQVVHGICLSSEGYYEMATADTVPLAKAAAKNISSHCGGWVRGYLANKGVKKACIERLLRKSFTTSSFRAALN